MTKIKKDKYNLELTCVTQRIKFVELIANHLNLNSFKGCLYIFINKYYKDEEKSYLINLYNSLKGDTNDVSNRIILYTLLLKKLNEVCNETEST